MYLYGIVGTDSVAAVRVGASTGTGAVIGTGAGAGAGGTDIACKP